MIEKIKYFFNKGHKRTILAKKNILFSFSLKIIGMAVMFYLVSISIKYLGKTNYGVWVTVSGIIAWAGMFDFGFSHGLRNKLTEAIAKKDYVSGRYLVSSTYFFILIIAIILLLVFYPVIYLVNWKTILNLPDNFDLTILETTLQIISIFFILQFSLKPINAILQAYQLPSLAQSLGTLGGVFTVIAISILYYFKLSPELIYYAYVIAGIPIIISLIATFYLFHKKITKLSPSFKFIKKKYVKSIGGLGLSFFIIQLALLVVYSSDNLIISYLFGPEEVAVYSIVFKYFSIITIFFGVIMAPFWSAITDAYTKGEMEWIQNTIRKLLKVILAGMLLAFVLFLVSPWLFKYWIDELFIAPSLLVGLMAVNTINIAYLNIFSFFFNGIGKIRMQLISYIFAAVINLPLSYLFGKTLKMGSSGVLLATITSILLVNILLSLQYSKIFNNTAKGVWDK